MKKTMITLLSVFSMLSFSAAVWAGPFEHYYDYQKNESADVGSFLTGGTGSILSGSAGYR